MNDVLAVDNNDAATPCPGLGNGCYASGTCRCCCAYNRYKLDSHKRYNRRNRINTARKKAGLQPLPRQKRARGLLPKIFVGCTAYKKYRTDNNRNTATSRKRRRANSVPLATP